MPQFSACRPSRVLGALAFMLVLSGVPVLAQSAYRLSFDQLVDKSDTIFVAECVDLKTTLSNGVIITRYKLKPNDVWKGQPSVNGAGELGLEELGGELAGPIPLASEVTGQAHLQKGEEVLLFTHAKPQSKRPKTGQPGPLADSSPRILGLNQGRFHVLKHPQSGEKLVTPGEPGEIERVLAKSEARLKQGGPQTAAQQANQNALKLIAQQATAARAHRDAAAKKQPDLAREIVPFEPLADVKSRVQQRLGTKK